MVIGPVEPKTNFRFRNIDDSESYINAIDVMIVKMLLLLDISINKLHQNSKMLNEALTLKILIICKKLLNIMDKTVIYQLPERVFIKSINYFVKKVVQKNSSLSLEMRNINQE